MKTKEELNALKEEIETLNIKLAELSEDELKQVTIGRSGKNYAKDLLDNIAPGSAVPDTGNNDRQQILL